MNAIPPPRKPLRYVFPGAIADAIRRELNGAPGTTVAVDQHQQNGCYGVHQLRVKLEGDETIYRVLVAPEDAPIQIGVVPADEHFIDKLRTGL